MNRLIAASLGAALLVVAVTATLMLLAFMADVDAAAAAATRLPSTLHPRLPTRPYPSRTPGTPGRT